MFCVCKKYNNNNKSCVLFNLPYLISVISEIEGNTYIVKMYSAVLNFGMIFFSMEFIYTTYTILVDIFSQYCLYIQALLGFLVIWIVIKKADKPIKDHTILIEDVLANWIPAPLVEEEKYSTSKHKYVQNRIVDKKIGKDIYISENKCLNLSSFNFLGYLENKEAEKAAIEAVKKYGIGSCGPRGFYGTVDVHLQLEEELAKFLGAEEAIVYSYGFSTIASAIPAYAKRSDVIFVDENVNFAIQKGMDASRSEIIYFKHNNINHLSNLLKEYTKREAKNKRKSKKVRKFLVVEGIYNKSGDICPLINLVKLKKEYKLRLFIDESISFGTLGKNGRGVTEYFDVPIKDVDLIMGSMENALSSVGGFCAGSSFIVEHQRLSGLGYCFSASLPPLLAVVAITNLNALQNNPTLVQKFNKKCENFQWFLYLSEIIRSVFNLQGDFYSPIKHLVLKYNEYCSLLTNIVDYCQVNGVALCCATYLEEDIQPCQPSIRISITNSLLDQDIKHAIQILENAIKEVLLPVVYSRYPIPRRVKRDDIWEFLNFA